MQSNGSSVIVDRAFLSLHLLFLLVMVLWLFIGERGREV